MKQREGEFWEIGRVMCNPTRIALHRLLVQEKQLSVSLAGALTGIVEPTASDYLAQMMTIGLITRQRIRLSVFYRAEPNPESAWACDLHELLGSYYLANPENDTAACAFKAFANEKRIRILKVAAENRTIPAPFLSEKLDIPSATVYRQCESLQAAGFFNSELLFTNPVNSFAAALFKLQIQ